jgi:phytoene dehydrogenase-like protein
MERNGRKIVIVGGGVAGLCAAVYAQKCGYQAEILEMHDMAGGLATNWRRGDYIFETCLHWLWGSNPRSPMHARWLEVCDLDELNFVYHDRMAHLETERGETLDWYCDLDRLQSEWTQRAPQDSAAIRRFMATIRSLSKFEFIAPGGGWPADLQTMLFNLPRLPLLRELMRVSARQYGERFSDLLIRNAFGEGDLGNLSALAVIFSLVWMCQRDAGYPIGGSQALIRLIEKKLAVLGGQIRFGARVERILVERGSAVGVRLANEEIISADWVISAADGHSTIYELLGGNYTSKAIDKAYAERETFPSYLQVSLGVARELLREPAQVTRLLDAPFEVDPVTKVKQLSFRIFNFDPTFAPAGKTAVTCFVPTRNFAYWESLRRDKPINYYAEKRRIADAVIAVLGQLIPGIHASIEMIDVSTPASVIRYTGNWKGSMEGWLVSPASGFKPLPSTLPGLKRFMMVGQWVMPGGGLPSGPMTARPVLQAICRHDHVPFLPGAPMAHISMPPPAIPMPGPKSVL